MQYSNEQLVNTFGKTATFLEIVGAVERQVATEGHVVCQVILNGVRLDEESESNYHTMIVSEIHQLDFVVAEQQDLINQLIKNWIETLPNLINHCDTFADMIRGHGLPGHYEEFMDFIEMSQYFVSSLIQLENILSEEILDQAEWVGGELEIKKAVEQALSAFDRKNFSELAEILEYDFAHGLTGWLGILRSLQKARSSKTV